MTDKKLLQKEIDYYTNLLKKHESISNENSKLSSLSSQPQNSHSKQPVLPAYKMVKGSSSVPTNSHKRNIQISSTNALSPNKRTVICHLAKHTKAKVGQSSQNVGCAKLPTNTVVSKRTVVNNIQNLVSVAKSSTANSCMLSNSSESEGLLKEIVFLTKLLKTSNDKTKPPAVAKDNSTNSIVDNRKIIDYGLKKCNVLSAQSLGQACNLPPSNMKQSSKFSIQTNKIISNLSTPQYSEPASFSKYSFKKVNSEQMDFSKTKHTVKVENKIEETNVLIKNMSDSQLQTNVGFSDSNKVRKQNNSNSLKNISAMHKILTPKKQVIDKRLSLGKCPSRYKVINKPSAKLKTSPIILKGKSSHIMKVKSPITFIPKHQAVFSKINRRNSSLYRKENLKSKFVYRRNSPSNQKTKSVHFKYKVVNKSNSQNSNKILNRQNSKSKLNTLLDKSDLFVELLDNSDIDKLEQRLLAVSTSLTATSNPVAKGPLISTEVLNSGSKNKPCMKKTPKYKVVTSKYKVVNKNTSKISSKLILKKTPTKKFKVLSSKYKFVNKNLCTPKNLSFKGKINNTPLRYSLKKGCKKIFSSKFSVVNKHLLSSAISPIGKIQPVLMKRVYMSRSTIINKNDSSTNHSAKLIKSKYLALNKRKSPSYQKHSLYPKMSFKLQRFKGPYIVNRRHSKLNRYHKSMAYSKGSRFFKNINYSSGRYHKNNSTVFKQKGKNVPQSPVLVIRGTRYSLSSSGKTLKRLPTKGQTRTNKTPTRIVIGGKPYVKTSENIMKVVNSPISVNIASRVLHRSINRVLTASSKKRLTKVNTYCMFYNRFGRCNRGVKCTYMHDPSKIAVCTRFLRGTCKTKECPFSHEVAPGKMAICSFFLVDACEKDNCPYRHEPLSPNAVLCKAFVQGYCPRGKECKKAHILICPKFILGECEKGSSCAYPHPPQKAKKNVPNNAMVTTDVTPIDEKEDDALLEKVARYFQPLLGNSTPYKKPAENFVPKHRKKLEEQPAFIPLCDTSFTLGLKQPN